MSSVCRSIRTGVMLSVAVFAWAPRAGLAETPGEIPKPWTYEGSKKLQEQQPQPAQQPQQQPDTRPSGAGAASGGAAGANLEAARSSWQQKPPLSPERNPLLGRWTRPPSAGGQSSDPFAALQALAKGGLCEALFGGGVFEFRPNALVGFDERTHEQELDRVEYRGDSRHVVVIPKTTIRLMEWDVESPNRINWASQHCVLVRVSAAGSAAASVPAAGARATMPPASQGPSSGGVLSLSVTSPAGSSGLAGRTLLVLKTDAQVALIKAGLQQTPYGTVLQNWIRACQSKTPECQQGAVALKTYTVGIATTDATGHAQTPALPAGRYWVVSEGKLDNRHVMWNAPVDVKDGSAALTLDQRNALPVD